MRTLCAAIVIVGAHSVPADAPANPPGIMFPPDPDTGKTCDFSKCAFNTAFIDAEKNGSDECLAACGKMMKIKDTNPCLEDCKVQMQIDTLVDLGKTNVTACADGLMEILEMSMAADDDEAMADMGPDFRCLIGCTGKVKGKSQQVKEDTLDGLGCTDWPPLLQSMKGNSCINECTQETKWAIGNSTGDGKKDCAEEAKEEAEEAAMIPDFSCLIGCDGPGGKKMTETSLSSLNCTQFDNMIVKVRSNHKNCLTKCTEGTKDAITNLQVGDSCNMGGDFGDGYDYYGDDDYSSGFHFDNSCIHTCPMGEQGSGMATGAKLQALSCQQFIAWGKSMQGNSCTSKCDDLTKDSLKDLSGRDPKDCDAGHKSEVKSALVAESESSQTLGKNALSLTLLVGASVGTVGTVVGASILRHRAKRAEASQEHVSSIPGGNFAFL